MNACSCITISHRLALAVLVSSIVILPEERAKKIPLGTFADYLAKLDANGVKINRTAEWPNRVPSDHHVIGRALAEILSPNLVFFDKGNNAFIARGAAKHVVPLLEIYANSLDPQEVDFLAYAAQNVVNGFLTAA